MKMHSGMTIGEAARRLGVSARTLRFYEEKALLAPVKAHHNGYRTYTTAELWRLQTIMALREAGMSVEEIKHALDHPASGVGTDELRQLLELQRAVLYEHMLEVKHRIAHTEGLLTHLRQQGSLSSDDMFRLADESKRKRSLRSWTDRWNYNSRAASHDQDVACDRDVYGDYAFTLQELVRRTRPKAGETGLDLGTGTGNLAGHFLEAGAVMHGVDQSAAMLRQCAAKLPGMETRLGNMLAIPYGDGTFDFLVSSYAFHHLTSGQVPLALDEFRRVLKPRGRFALADHMEPEAIRTLEAWLEHNDYMHSNTELPGAIHLIHAIPLHD